MASKIAPLAPLSLTPSNSNGKSSLPALGGVTTPGMNSLEKLEKLEKPKSSAGKRSSAEKKKARKLKMEKLRHASHATKIQSFWRGVRARNQKGTNSAVAKGKAINHFLDSYEKTMKNVLELDSTGTENDGSKPETVEGKEEHSNTQVVVVENVKERKPLLDHKEEEHLDDPPIIDPLDHNAKEQVDNSPEIDPLNNNKEEHSHVDNPPVTDGVNNTESALPKIIDKEAASNVTGIPQKLDSNDESMVDVPAPQRDQNSQEVENNLQNVEESPGNQDIDDKPSVWPESFHDTFTEIGDSSLHWPDLIPKTPFTNDNHPTDTVLKWVLTNQQVLTRTITWNMQASEPPPVEKVQKILLPLNKFHIIAFGTEECERSIAKSALNPSKKVWESYLLELVGSEYTPLRSHTLQAIHVMVFVHTSLFPLVSEISSAAVACGMANTLGNKGGVGISFRMASTRFLIINNHLSAHQEKNEERNFQVWKILNELSSILQIKDGDDDVKDDDGKVLSSSDSKNNDDSTQNENAVKQEKNNISLTFKDGVDKLERNFDCLIFMGDLNYRINGNRKVIDKLLDMNMYEVLKSNDQLTVSFSQNKLPKFLTESNVTFRPTYKFDKNCDVYDTSAKKRIPSWTDRILFGAKNLTCLNYNSVTDLRISDHRPVYASFSANISVQNHNVKRDEEAHAYSSESQVCTIM